ncbi:MAG: efflux transporter periplasmic adaptor subunit [Sphingobacteriia bacterium 24-36-13]|jgi:cobalt-zinc-cadmium efflux system membrane fusion protein|uniref:efflux RND transporter periplasmic adaptor subunit n=1 Tax=Sediminibacterium sp. TaxID=1917865 RepID=UPI000BD9DB39|nr:efflux RND transporter periplasmic adaptor subunit [Sediminibacterium sp.]OYZ55320.1 MAG: efflux transporter periplasmic adaptor subunit [Sphingobacteriia bacterium 24-36-13]OZA66280.1 MAG: efflux transporter periplasmic adaptor subunit [Sphingobacteriia bacterium 39-36-14]HQS22858.1 efflux RND transporter periplasmic adaptor subunit [Sediminibacterium sp.]HQS33965.1 efflux RND transporter periplasmic adaptor subunit [Sediminibacterium sp.]
MNLSLNKNISLAMLALLFLAACSNKQESADNDTTVDTAGNPKDTAATTAKQIIFTSEQYRLAGIATGAVEMRNLSNIIKLNGVIDVEPQSSAIVSAPLGGYLKTAGLLPGQAVRKGEVLATIENPQFVNMQQDYLESKGRLQYLEQEYKRQQKLREEDVNSAKTFQQVASEYKVMQARISGLEQNLALAGISRSSLRSGKITRTANLYAPISGYIKTSNVSIGKYANPTDVLFELINKDDIHLALDALEKDLGKIQVGQTVKFSSANENNFNRTAKIFLVGKSTGDDRIIPVHCHIEKQHENGLLPGMYVKAWIETGTEKQYAVPSEAIVQLEGKDYLIVQTGQSSTGYTFQLEEIKKGTEQEGYTAVTLPQDMNIEKTKVVVKNAYAILSALKNSEEE